MSLPQGALDADLGDIVAHVGGAFHGLRGARIFITGGTGFIGTWLIESFLHANRELGLGATMVALSRSPGSFAAKAPALVADQALTLVRGDVRDFIPPEGHFTHVIHAATDASAKLNDDAPLDMVDTIVMGTRRVLDVAVSSGAQHVLFVSSGAVYGAQPPNLAELSEEYSGGPDPLAAVSAYHEGKRLAEQLCAIYGRKRGISHLTVARCFAFVGPWLPLDAHFAIGNFIGNGIAGQHISITGDGTSVRSYLYAADLASWLWTILLAGTHLRPYNVGSPIGLSMREIADVVSKAFPTPLEYEVLGRVAPGIAPNRYVPSIARAQRELGLQVWTPLPMAVHKTIAWHRQHGSLI